MNIALSKKFWIVSVTSFVVFIILSFSIRSFEKNTTDITASILMPQPTEVVASKSDAEWDIEYAQTREEGKKLCDEYQYPAGTLDGWKEGALKMFTICKNAEHTKDYINVSYSVKELYDPSPDNFPKIKFEKVNGVNLIALIGVSTSNYYIFIDESTDRKKFSDLLVDNNVRHSPSYEIASDSFGNQWFVSTQLTGSGSDMSKYTDSWYWIDKNLKLSKVLEYNSFGGFGTGWGIFNDDGWLASAFSVKYSPKAVAGTSYVDFDFSRSYQFAEEDLVSNKISMRYRWNSKTKNFVYVSGDSGFRLNNIDGDNSPLFTTKIEKCDVNWILCMNAEFIKENYTQLMQIATGSDVAKKKALEGILLKNPSEKMDAKEKQELNWFHNLAQVMKLLNLNKID